MDIICWSELVALVHGLKLYMAFTEAMLAEILNFLGLRNLSRSLPKVPKVQLVQEDM